MKSYREELWFETKTRRAFINITSQVERCVMESGVNSNKESDLKFDNLPVRQLSVRKSADEQSAAHCAFNMAVIVTRGKAGQLRNV